MSRKYALIAIIVATLALAIGGWGISTVLVSPSSNAPRSNDTAQHTNPNWSFPSHGEPVGSFPDFRPVVTEVMPSVVSVASEIVVSGFFGQSTEYVAGSGIIIDAEGYIVTNNHVIEDARDIYVELTDGRTFPANVVGTDPLSDLAVIGVNATNLPYAYWGSSSSLSLGEWVLAIGNALGAGITVTEGIVSRLDVPVNVDGNVLYGLIQTTAAINPGNSGGPLVNLSGEVIGITSVKVVASEVEGIGYAIGSREARPIIEDLIRCGRVTYPWLGVGVSTVTPLVVASKHLSVDRGALIEDIVPNSPAEAAGLQIDDVIVRFADREITNLTDLVQAIRSSEIGEDVEIVFVRGNDTRATSARLIERPAS